MSLIWWNTYKVSLQTHAYKACNCESCGGEYYYPVQRRTEGRGISVYSLDNLGARERAKSAAQWHLNQAIQLAVEPVACPMCGWMQKNMVHVLNMRVLMYCFYGSFLAVIAGLTFWSGGRGSWSLTVACHTLAGLILFYGIARYLFYTPNRLHPGPGGKLESAAKSSVGIDGKQIDQMIAAES